MRPFVPNRPDSAPAPGWEFAGLNVLVVDDVPAIRRMLVLMLRHLGVKGLIREAGDGREALERLEEQPFDLVICDINMPRMNGLELLHRLKASPRLETTPVLLITGEVSQEIAARAALREVDSYLPKPFQVKTLEIHLRQILRSLSRPPER
jgi:two-component system chemotaxis response regulator CheY